MMFVIKKIIWYCYHYEPKFINIVINFMNNHGLSYETINVNEIFDYSLVIIKIMLS